MEFDLNPEKNILQPEQPHQKKYLNNPKHLESSIHHATHSDYTAIVMAECSILSYWDFEKNIDELENHLKDGNFKLIEARTQDPQFFLASHKDYSVIAFRGTETNNLDDLKTDLNIKRQRTHLGKLHSGFLNSYCRVHELLSSIVCQIKKPIYITGHSLGGALATIATSQLSSYNLAACYTFGAPHIGSQEFDFQLKVPLYRIVNHNDVVPHLLGWHRGYHHPGYLYFLTKNSKLIRSPGFFQKTLHFFPIQILKFWKTNQKCSLTGHCMPVYLEKLKKIAQSRRHSMTNNTICN